MKENGLLWLFVQCFIYSGVISTVAGNVQNNVQSDEKLVYVTYGSTHQFKPCSRRAWSFCTWSREGVEECSSGPSASVIQQTICQISGSRWLDDCVLEVRNMTDSKAGVWSLNILLGNSEEQEFVKCEEKISIAYPAKVSMTKLPYSMIVGEPYVVQCTADSTNPPPVIKSFVKSENNTRYLEEATDRQGKRVNIFQFTPELQEAGSIEVWCTLEQDIGYDVLRHDAALTSTVIFPPQPPTHPLKAEVLVNETAEISFVVRSLPVPTLADISWHFVGPNSSTSFQMMGTDETENYKISLQVLKEDLVNITVTISCVSPTDKEINQYIRIKTAAGSRDYQIYLNVSTEDQLDLESSSVAHIILALSIGTLLVLVIGISLLLNAKATGKWCFATGKTKEPEITLSHQQEGDGNNGDTQNISGGLQATDSIKLIDEGDVETGVKIVLGAGGGQLQAPHSFIGGGNNQQLPAPPPAPSITPPVERRARREIIYSKSRSPSPSGRASFRRSSSKRSSTSTTMSGGLHRTSSANAAVSKKISVTSRESTYPVC